MKSLIPYAPLHCAPRRAGCHSRGPAPHGRQYIYRFGCQLPNNSCMQRIPQICRHSFGKPKQSSFLQHEATVAVPRACQKNNCSELLKHKKRRQVFVSQKCFPKVWITVNLHDFPSPTSNPSLFRQGSVSWDSSSFTIKQ